MIDNEYAKSLAAKAPPPDELEAMGPMEEGEDEAAETADDAAFSSAFDDFAAAAGFKPTPAAKAALKDLIRYCK